MSDNTMPERITQRDARHRPVEYIRADVAQAQIDAANARIAELEAAQAWVSVDERLPEPGDIVLAYLPDYEELVIVNKWPKRQATSRVGSSWHESSRVTHWMPLPPPPVTDVTP